MWFVCIFLKQTSSALLSNHCTFPASLLPLSSLKVKDFYLAVIQPILSHTRRTSTTKFSKVHNFTMIKETGFFATEMRDDINLRQGFPKTEVALCRWQPDHSNTHHETCKMLLECSPKHHRYCLLFNKNGKIKII